MVINDATPSKESLYMYHYQTKFIIAIFVLYAFDLVIKQNKRKDKPKPYRVSKYSSSIWFNKE